MKNTRYIYWKGWILTSVILVGILLILNFAFPLRPNSTVVGDEKEWLSICVNVISPILAAIVAYILQIQYDKQKKAKEQERTLLRHKIDNAKSSYAEIKNIIENNLSVFDFGRFSKLIYLIDANTTNTSLIGAIHDYQSLISEAQKKTVIVLDSKSSSVKLIAYKSIFSEYLKLYARILPAFIEYLNKVDDKVNKNMKNIDIILPRVQEEGKQMLSMLKMEGNNLIYNWKNEFITILNDQKPNIDKMSNLLDTFSQKLLSEEQKKISVLESELENVK